MATITRMPELAANTPDAVLSEWLVKEGAEVSAGDPIATVETAKATVDIEAEVSGVVLRLVVEDGAEVLVGAPILVIGERGEEVPAAVDDDAPAAEPTAASAAPAAAPAAATPAPTPAGASAPVERAGRIFSSPLARKLAREGGIELAEVTGTGPNGRVVRRDVVAARETRPAARTAETGSTVAAPVNEDSGYVDRPHTRLRRAIAARLTESKREAPHFYVRGTADAGALLVLRARLVEESGVRISVNDLIVKAVARAHVREPRLNVIWTDDAVRSFDTVDIAVAVATDDGLVTPVLRGVEQLSLSSLAARTRGFAESARAGSLRPADLAGGTITVSNLGMFGTQEFAAIINPPQASILAVGAAVDSALVRDGQVVAGRTITFTLSVDHRPVDGAVAAAWMREFLAIVESPMSLVV